MKYKDEYQPSELLEPVLLQPSILFKLDVMIPLTLLTKATNVFTPWDNTRAWFQRPNIIHEDAECHVANGGGMDVEATPKSDDEVEEELEDEDEDEDGDIPYPPPPGMLDPSMIDWALERGLVIEDRTLFPAGV
jgi:hypothetical protein